MGTIPIATVDHDSVPIALASDASGALESGRVAPLDPRAALELEGRPHLTIGWSDDFVI